jgi:predicted dithiol-disulfide oxidoreductase (DUF899 family)
MDLPKAVSRAEWLVARQELLAKEKELTRQRDALSAERRRLPMVEVEQDYVLTGPSGPVRLSELFTGCRQLIVYHFMFDPSWDEGCPSCSFLADTIGVAPVHLAARDTAFAVVSRAPLGKIEAFRRRMGWDFRWLSSEGSTFNRDFQVTLDAVEGAREYNYTDVDTLLADGKIWTTRGEMPGLSVFLRDGERTYHTYSAYQRGLDPLLNVYNYLDLTPRGRQDAEGANPMAWIRHHDRYDMAG